MEFEKLQVIVAEVLGKDSEQIYAKARLVEDLGVDKETLSRNGGSE